MLVAIKRIRNVFRNNTEAKRILREVCAPSFTVFRVLMRDRLISPLVLFRSFETQIRILTDLHSSPHVVKIIDVLMPADPSNFDQLYIVMEYVESDLQKLLAKMHPEFTEAHLKTIMYRCDARLFAVFYV